MHGLRLFLVRAPRLLAGSLLWGPFVSIALFGATVPPPSAQRPVTNVLHQTSLIDPFQWLEGDPQQSPEVAQWLQAQRDYTRAEVHQLPLRPYIQKRLLDWHSQPAELFRGLQWTKDRAFLLVADTYSGPRKLIHFPSTFVRSNRIERAIVLVNPLDLDPTGLTDIDWYAVSPNGSHVAVLLARHGDPSQSLHFWEVESAKKLPDIVPDAQRPSRRGAAAWSAGSQYVLYSSYPTNDLSPGEVKLHRLGSESSADSREAIRELPAGGEIEIRRNEDGGLFIVSAHRPDIDEHLHWIRERNGRWRTIAKASDRVEQVEFGRAPVYLEAPQDESLYALSRDRAPHGRIFRVSLSAPAVTVNSDLVVPELTDLIDSFKPSASGMYLSVLRGGKAFVAFFDRFEKEPIKNVVETPTPGTSSLDEWVVTRGDELLYRVETFLESSEWRGFDPNRSGEKTFFPPFIDSSPVDFVDAKVERMSVRSPDGAKIPLFIIQRKWMRSAGDSPWLLTGYGAAGESQLPRFDWLRRLWLDQVGFIAVAQLRGGSEFGPAWRAAGSGANKRKAFEDLQACARFLVASNFTRANRLAVIAEGHGAAAAAALAIDRPDSVQALVLRDGYYDLIRAELFPSGFRVASEYGFPGTPSVFAALERLSPYRLSETQRPYPAAMFVQTPAGSAGAGMHSRKMAARWQTGTTASRPVFYRTPDAPPRNARELFQQTIERFADEFSFLCDQLNVPFTLVDRGPWSGGVTPVSATVKAKLVSDGMAAELLVSEDATLKDALRLGAVRTRESDHNLVSYDVDRLRPDTAYHYALEINGRVDWASRGRFRTLPPGPASFRMAFASCAKTASASEVFDRIRENHPLFFMNMGDFHYLNINTNSVERYRNAYDQVLSSLPQTLLYRDTAFVYMRDDHDYGGNNSNRKAASHEAARKAYAEYVPHYPLAAGGGDQAIYQSFEVGRVKFILTDLRSERDDVKKTDDAGKSMMGAKQKAWFKDQLLAANGKYPLICWMSSVPWLGAPGANYYSFIKADQHGWFHHTNATDTASKTNKPKPSVEEDHWAVFSAERREIADFVKEHRIQGLCILHGDSHMLAADDGSNGDFATGGGAPIPVMCAAPLDQTSSIKGGPYSQGVYKVKKDEGCFGLLDIVDRGTAIDVSFSGRNIENKEKISLRFSVPAQTSAPPRP
ncbi:MAG: alkaline phosphatase D family protein [Verrucomicrobia bacterium]|nr:alkaline phosphatase D family protein [Verrucomicrobiota bacterium]